jgi:hypothetical protein
MSNLLRVGVRALDAMDVIEVHEKVTEGGATEVGLIHLMDGDTSNQNRAMSVQSFVIGGDKHTKLKNEVGLLGHRDVDEFTEVA